MRNNMEKKMKFVSARLRRFTAVLAASTGLLVGFGVVASPAMAAKKQKEESAPKANYSKEFIAVYKPLEALSKAETPDAPALRAGIEKMLAVVSTDDDKLVAGSIMNTIGSDIGDVKLQRKGLGLVLESNRFGADKVGVYNFAAGQLAYSDEDYVAARGYFVKAYEAGYDKADVVSIISEASVQAGNFAEGFDFLRAEIAKRAANGQTPPKDWISRGLTNAYNNEKAGDAVDFSVMLAKYYPSETSWRDAINIQRNLLVYENPEMLDLMRLGYLNNTLNTQRDYIDYADAADVLRLPGEVKTLLDKGIAAGFVNTKEVVIGEAMRSAQTRIAADKADLAAIEAQALSPSSKLNLSVSTADGFLGYNMADKAEAIYKVALGKAGVNADLVNTRIGIAQVKQGKYADASATFAKVGGKRAYIGKLWKVYAEMKANPVPAPAAAAASEPAAK